MTGQHLVSLLGRLAPEGSLRGGGNAFALSWREREVTVVFDTRANRMRAMSVAADAAILDETILMHMARAGFSTLLDVRYAVADGRVWSVFLHPLDTLAERDLVSALDQVVEAARTFGAGYSSDDLVFRGGDPNTHR